jgi:ATP-dependent Lon protease
MTSGENPSRPAPAELDTVPILPLRNSVLFPMSVVPINVGRAAQRAPRRGAARQGARARRGAAQRSPDVDEPTFKELYTVGTLARVVKVIRLGPPTTRWCSTASAACG